VVELSVVIPTRNRPQLLRRCVDRLAEQTLDPSDYEIIVVDDGSDEATLELPQAASGAAVRLLRQAQLGPAAARNLGVRQAAAGVIVFLGDDILAPPGFLEVHRDWHRAHPSPWEGMLGRVDWPDSYLRDHYMRWLDASGLQFGYAGLRAGQPLRYYHFYTSNVSLKRGMLLEHPFDEEFQDAAQEDTELGLRLEAAGFQLYFEPRSTAEHHHFYTLEASCRHRRRVGRAGYLFRRKHPDKANFKWIRRLPWPVRLLVSSRPYGRIAYFAERQGNPGPISYYYYLRNSEAFWEGFREASAGQEIGASAGRDPLEKAAASAAQKPGEAPPDSAGAGEVVSVVILTYNGGDLLRRALDQVFRQRTAAELDVVLVDSGSTDGTEKLNQDYPVRIKSIPSESFTYGYARNLGFRTARGSFIGTISQDFVPRDENWLENLISPLRNGADVVQGNAMPPSDRRPFYWETRRFWFTRESQDFKRRHNGFCFSCVNLATRRDVWSATGFGDKTPMSEDIYFQKKAFERGYRRAVQAPQATGFHGHQFSVRSLFRRCENEGLGWRWVGESYSVGSLMLDLLRPSSYAKLLLGLVRGQIRTPAELLFIWIRPLAVFQGNHFGRRWQRQE
jgi:rhamnosyltransferase